MARKSDISHIADQELLAAYRSQGNRELFGELFDRYRHLVFGVCLKYLQDREEARDAVMTIFERLLDDLKIREVDHFPGWVYTVSRNHCLMALRKHSGQMSRLDEFRREQPTADVPAEGPTVAEIREAGIEKLELAIAGLKPEQRQCVVLFFLNNKSYREISEQTGLTLNDVKSYIQNGKRNLKIKLSESA
ncbi:MAG: hypothetical protein RL220_1425 [Bacteroidota bacterium]